MMTIKIFVGEEQIDEVSLGRMEQLGDKDKTYVYRITKPKWAEGLLVNHKYSDGRYTLIRKVMEILGDFK